MQRRTVRLAILALLLVAGAAAAFFTWDFQRRAAATLAGERDVDQRLDTLGATVAVLRAAQQGYVAPGQQRGEAIASATTAIQHLYDGAAALRPLVQSAGAAATLRTLGEHVDAAVKIDDRVREHLRIEQELMAADLVYTEGRQSIDALASTLAALHGAERNATIDSHRTLTAQSFAVVGVVALVWVAGLLLLATAPGTNDVLVRESTPAEPEVVEPSLAPTGPAPIDLGDAAAVCTEFSRLSSVDGLPRALARAADVLDANGLIVWLGAGEELFAATAHGYSAAALAHFGPIPRTGENATAAAWRSAEVRTVGGDSRRNGAIVAPLIGPAGCFGVLAAEVRAGREEDASARAVASMIAAQLSAIVAPGPAPSHADESLPLPTADETSAQAASA
jgi:hypothetical protein